MMEIYVYVILTVEVILMIVMLYIITKSLPFFLKKERELREKELDIRLILDEINSRISFRDEKIAELLVRVDALEEKYKRVVEGVGREFRRKEERGMKRKESFEEGGLVTLILTLLKDGPLTSTEIQKRVGRSREHVARFLKSLYERGLVERDEAKKPYVYKISEKGIKLIEGIS